MGQVSQESVSWLSFNFNLEWYLAFNKDFMRIDRTVQNNKV